VDGVFAGGLLLVASSGSTVFWQLGKVHTVLSPPLLPPPLYYDTYIIIIIIIIMN
jgi:hypothetical protein